jgi:hypothetical protein
MSSIRRFLAFYIQDALPFGSGVLFAVLAIRLEYAWYWEALAGAILVVVGPLAIQVVLTLIVESLSGLGDGDDEAGGALPRTRSLFGGSKDRAGTRRR